MVRTLPLLNSFDTTILFFLIEIGSPSADNHNEKLFDLC